MSKRALLIGINYAGSSAELRGCIQDVKNVRDFLRHRGYGEGDIVELTDDTATKPTRVGIILALTELILSGASVLYFHYSGHGSYVRDISRDEKDYKDECLVPIDYAASGMIIDDELRGVLQLLRPNQRLFAVLDCCHSGTGLDLRYGLYEAYSGARLQMFRDYRAPPRTRGQAIMISGCLDSQTSADAWEEGEFQGAMTFAFLKTMEGGAGTYEELIKKVRIVLKERGYSQLPTLTSGRKLTLNSALIV